jgi:glycosyltransferase involved in cell wall biosynthesis
MDNGDIKKRMCDYIKNSPLLSVIVANYNNQSYIKECLDSIMSQTFKDLEIIVSDDCSTDNSLEIAKEYEKKYPGIVKMIASSINRGVAQTRHEAILQAKGEYITTLDSDDYYYDNQKLEKEMELVSHYKEKASKDIMAYSNIVMVKGDKTLIGIQGNSKNIKEGQIFNDIITRSCLIPRDFIVKREVYFEVGGYDFKFPIYEDWDLKIRLAKKYEFYYTGVNGTAYRRHGTGLSSYPIPDHIKILKKIFKKNSNLVDKIEKKGVINGFKNFIKVLRNSYREKRRGGAKNKFIKRTQKGIG